ncbi:hypothetical protein L596_011624 [Steinernema carpocapsae]|uniref:Uncharacterized protein n=1 Tax=Steinernema carpocapsae TaxID=34508 RepID=A0A4U5NUH8_STECR|nr:hypothetical protein L596_011624 [Steinernema carpocapsae]
MISKKLHLASDRRAEGVWAGLFLAHPVQGGSICKSHFQGQHIKDRLVLTSNWPETDRSSAVTSIECRISEFQFYQDCLQLIKHLSNMLI